MKKSTALLLFILGFVAGLVTGIYVGKKFLVTESEEDEDFDDDFSFDDDEDDGYSEYEKFAPETDAAEEL